MNFNIYYLIDDQSILERKDYHMMKPAPYCVKFPTFQLSKDKIKRLGKVWTNEDHWVCLRKMCPCRIFCLYFIQWPLNPKFILRPGRQDFCLQLKMLFTGYRYVILFFALQPFPPCIFLLHWDILSGVKTEILEKHEIFLILSLTKTKREPC